MTMFLSYNFLFFLPLPLREGSQCICQFNIFLHRDTYSVVTKSFDFISHSFEVYIGKGQTLQNGDDDLSPLGKVPKASWYCFRLT